MATLASLNALDATQKALKEIKLRLEPLLVPIRSDDADPQEIASAQAGIALTLGTLRFMAQRMKGTKVGSKDPIRLELNRLRQLLVKVQKKSSSHSLTTAPKRSAPLKDNTAEDSDVDNPTGGGQSPSKRQRRR